MNERFVLATANPDKAAEIVGILGSVLGDGVELLGRPTDVPDVEETGSTLEENARLKAQALAEATGLPALGDDTGLEVDALDGAPGVYSSRFAGPGASYADNVAHLLEALEGVGAEARTARFVTVAAAVWPDGREILVRGAVEGTITTSPRGDGGFGYDPVFAVRELGGATFAEVGAEQKHAVSHRGRAFRALAEALVVEAGR